MIDFTKEYVNDISFLENYVIQFDLELTNFVCYSMNINL